MIFNRKGIKKATQDHYKDLYHKSNKTLLFKLLSFNDIPNIITKEIKNIILSRQDMAQGFRFEHGYKTRHLNLMRSQTLSAISFLNSLWLTSNRLKMFTKWYAHLSH